MPGLFQLSVGAEIRSVTTPGVCCPREQAELKEANDKLEEKAVGFVATRPIAGLFSPHTHHRWGFTPYTRSGYATIITPRRKMNCRQQLKDQNEN
jgi:hypothetical protein